MYNDLIKETLNKNKENYINKLIELVKLDTANIGHGIDGGKEANGQIFLKQLFTEMNAQKIEEEQLTEDVIEKCKDLYNDGSLNHNYVNRYNLYATFNGKSGKSIMFNGHIDNMPAEASLWATDPLDAHIKDDKIIGVGVADMKSGLMASIMAVQLLKDAKIDLPGNVIISSVCDEEGGGNGSIYAAMNGLRADGVVVCEATNYELITAHMGWVFFKIEVEGKSVHSGLKLLGENAIEKSYKIMREINNLEHKWLLKYKHPLLPSPSSNVGVIYGGDAGSTIPDYCCFKSCVHYQPGMTYEQVVEDYMGAINLACDGDEWLKNHRPKVSIYQTGNPFEMDMNSDLVTAFKEAYSQSLGREVKIVGSPAGCDSRTWLNIAKCPTIQYGPGSLEQSHTINEYVTIEQYLDAIEVYANLILDWNNKPLS